jgi:hypothetical protein
MPDSPSPTRWPAYARVPPFLPVPVRSRRDGWTVERQGRFVGLLAETGCVAEAARRVGMSRMAAWRLRRRPLADSLAHAWDWIMAVRAGAEDLPRRKVTHGELMHFAIRGPIRVRMRRGKFLRARREPSDSALLRLFARAASEGRLSIWNRR